MENRNTVKLKNSTKSTKLHITAYTPTHTHYSRRSEKCVTGKTKKKQGEKAQQSRLQALAHRKRFQLFLPLVNTIFVVAAVDNVQTFRVVVIGVAVYYSIVTASLLAIYTSKRAHGGVYCMCVCVCKYMCLAPSVFHILLLFSLTLAFCVALAIRTLTDCSTISLTFVKTLLQRL